ncbi:MAG: hypothetical protein QM758_04745 [Armatimonas sp.]
MDRRTFLALLLPATASAAQQTLPPAPTPPTLSELLQSTRWTPSTAQTLLVIGGKQTKILPEASNDSEDSIYVAYYNRVRHEALVQLGPPPSSGYTLSGIAPLFGRKVMRYGNLASLTPTHRRSLNLTPGAPLLDFPEREYNMFPDNVRPLVEVLDDAVLEKLMNPYGLGREHLPPRLQPLFDAILPEPVRIMRTGGILVRAIEGEQAKTLRLRVSLAVTISALRGKNILGGLTFVDRIVLAEDPIVTPFGHVDKMADGLGVARSFNPEPKPMSPAIFGKNLVTSTPASALPSALASESLKRTISLEGISLLGQLMTRLAEAEGVTLILPPPLNEWSVEWRGNPEVRTVELVQAILASTNGTFRECGGSYLLTEDQTPLGPRLEQLFSLDREEPVREEQSSKAGVFATGVGAFRRDMPLPDTYGLVRAHCRRRV